MVSIVTGGILAAFVIGMFALLAATHESRQSEAAAREQYQVARQRMLKDDGKPRWGYVPGAVRSVPTTALPADAGNRQDPPATRGRRSREDIENIGEARRRMLDDPGIGRWGHRRGITPDEARAQQRETR